jgi:hypothetical protein
MKSGFETYLKRSGRSANAAARIVRLVRDFERYLAENAGSTLDAAAAQDLEEYIGWYERETGSSAKGPLWAIRYYYQFIGDDDLATLASLLRQQRIQRKPFPLKEFRGVDADDASRLAEAGVENVKQMLKAGATAAGRRALAERSGIPLATIVELVKLSDLSRIAGLKQIRARLYHDSGVDTVEKVAGWDPAAMRQMMRAYIEETGFDGVAPLLGEARAAVKQARRLHKVVEYGND